MAGAYLRGKPEILWKGVVEKLRQAQLKEIKPLLHYPRSLVGAIEMSVDALEARERERYLALAVLLALSPPLMTRR